MALLPEHITTNGLGRRWRGLDPAQVAALLDQLRTDYTGALQRIGAEAAHRAAAHDTVRELHGRAEALTAAAETEATAIRDRAQDTARSILHQADQAADALVSHAEHLREQAKRDAHAARARLEQADQRARELEDTARKRWLSLRADTDAQFDHLRAAELSFARRLVRAQTTLSGLRSHLALADQIQRAESMLAELQTPTYRDHHGQPAEQDADGQDGSHTGPDRPTRVAVQPEWTEGTG